MIKYLKIPLRFLLAIIIVITTYILEALLLSNIESGTTGQVDPTIDIFVSSNGVHTDVIIEKKQLPLAFVESLKLSPATRYFAFGWEDKGFYLDTPEWKDLKFSTAFKAMFLKSATAIHVSGYERRAEDWMSYKISQDSYSELHSFINESFRTKNGEIMLVPHASYGTNDRLFEAIGSYSCLKTCNTWTNQALKAANVPTSVWTPFDWGVYRYIEKKN